MRNDAEIQSFRMFSDYENMRKDNIFASKDVHENTKFSLNENMRNDAEIQSFRIFSDYEKMRKYNIFASENIVFSLCENLRKF